MTSIGERLKEERKRLNMNQKDFAELAKTGITAQVNYEKGVRSPSSDYLSELAKHGVDISYIITGERKVTLDDLVELQQCVLEVEEWLQKNKKELQKEQLLNAAKQLFKAKRERVPTGTAIDLILNTATSA